MTDVDKTPDLDNQNIQDQNQSSNDLADKIVGRYRAVRATVSPWIQRNLDEMQDSKAHMGQYIPRSPIALSSQNTSLLVDRVQRMGERSVIWHAEEISLTPNVVDRFATDITGHFSYQPIAIRGDLENQELQLDTTAESLPLAGVSSSSSEPQTPAPSMRFPTSQTPAKPAQPTPRQTQSQGDPAPPAPPHFMAQKQDRRPSWLPKRKEKPVPTKPSVSIALQKQELSEQPSRVKPDSQSLRLFSRVDYLTDMGKSPSIEDDISPDDEITPVDSPESHQEQATQVAPTEKVDGSDDIIQTRITTPDSFEQIDEPPPSIPPSAKHSDKPTVSVTKAEPLPDTDTKPAVTTQSTPRISPKTERPQQSQTERNIVSRKSEARDERPETRALIETELPTDLPTSAKIDSGQEDIEPPMPGQEVVEPDQVSSDQYASEQPRTAPQAQTPPETSTTPELPVSRLSKPQQPASALSKQPQQPVSSTPPSVSDTHLAQDVPAESTPQFSEAADTTIGRQMESKAVVVSPPQLPLTRRMPLTISRMPSPPRLPLVTAKQARSRLQARGWRFKQKQQSEQPSDPVQVSRAVDTLEQPSDSGQPIPDAPRNIAERALGHDFSPVRLHKAQLAPLNIEAATHDQDVYVDSGHKDFDTPESLGLLGHELTHVAQRGLVQTKRVEETAVLPQVHTDVGQSSMGAIQADEHEADRTEQRVLNYLQRQPINQESSQTGLAQPFKPKQARPQPKVQQPAIPEPVMEWLAAQETVQRYPLVTPAPNQVSRQEADAGGETATGEEAQEEETKEQQSDLDQLAKQIYPLIKQMIRVERERRPNQRNSRFGSF